MKSRDHTLASRGENQDRNARSEVPFRLGCCQAISLNAFCRVMLPYCARTGSQKPRSHGHRVLLLSQTNLCETRFGIQQES